MKVGEALICLKWEGEPLVLYLYDDHVHTILSLEYISVGY